MRLRCHVLVTDKINPLYKKYRILVRRAYVVIFTGSGKTEKGTSVELRSQKRVVYLSIQEIKLGD
jgi:hypothetical protein